MMYFKNFFENLIIYPIILIVLVKAWMIQLKWYVNHTIYNYENYNYWNFEEIYRID